MKLVTAEVYVLGRQTVDDAELERFLVDHDAQEWGTDTEVGAEKLSETAGRVCYMSFAKPRPGGNSAYLHHIKEVGHGSVLEHAVWNLLITGVSRSLTHELVRHRQGLGYSQLSQRYVDESVAEYVVPPDLKEEVAAAQAFLKAHAGDFVLGRMRLGDMAPATACQTAIELIGVGAFKAAPEVTPGLYWLAVVGYSHLGYVNISDYLSGKAAARGLEKTEGRKFARQAARSVLPNAAETKIFVTANARALRHMIEMRCSKHADPEIRVLFGKVWQLLAAEAPSLFGDYTKLDLPDGTFELTTPYRKV